MYLALRELRHSKLRYFLITFVIVLVSSLVFILTGLATGLAKGNSEAIDAIDADTLAFSTGSEFRLDRSAISPETVESIRSSNGVEAAEPFGAGPVNITRPGSEDIIGMSLIGVEPGSFLDPGASDGDALDSGDRVLVADQSLLDEGVNVGDTITVRPSGIELRVVGSVDGHQLQLIGTGYVSLDTWLAIREASGNTSGDVNAVAIRGGTDGIGVDGLEFGSRADTVNALPGYVEQNATLTMIQWFLVIIAAGIISAFFFIITLQKMPELGVMKAIGTPTGTLAKSLIYQVAMLGIVGVIIGIAIGCTTEIIVRGKVPFLLQWESMLQYGLILLGVGLLGTLMSLFRISRVDPLDAINNAG